MGAVVTVKAMPTRTGIFQLFLDEWPMHYFGHISLGKLLDKVTDRANRLRQRLSIASWGEKWLLRVGLAAVLAGLVFLNVFESAATSGKPDPPRATVAVVIAAVCFICQPLCRRWRTHLELQLYRELRS